MIIQYNMYKIVLLMFSFIAFIRLDAQTIKRWKTNKAELNNTVFSFKLEENIFDKFDWTFPEIKARKLVFDERGTSEQLMGTEKLIFSKEGEKLKLTTSDGESYISAQELSNGKMYYNKTVLKWKTEYRNAWKSKTVYTSQTVAVPRTRMVTTYSYNSNGVSTPSYRNETYFVNESRQVPSTEWYYDRQATLVLDIPKYNTYKFSLQNGLHIIVYEDKNQYFIQNTSFLIGQGEDDLNYLFIDANNNGQFLDSEDKIMFNSWNPYSESSKFKGAGVFKDNNWYDLVDLSNNNFVYFNLNEKESTIQLEYENSEYNEEKDKGKVTFENLPKDAKLYVNGEEYKIKKETAKFKSEYGKFKIRIANKGFLDFEKIYFLDSDNPEIIISYEETSPAGSLLITNIFEQDFFVNIEVDGNKFTNLKNITELNLPQGNVKVSIFSNGFLLEKELIVEKGVEYILDYEAELVKLTGDSKEIED